MPATIELQSVTRRYGEVVAVDKVSVTIEPGEFFSMLGPSGSGKTSCLRLIAGFEQPDSGAVILNGLDMTRTAPYDRDVNTVFQDYALFPHLTVQKNVEYGLRMRGIGDSERFTRAREALEQVALDGFHDRKPAQLSGGQRQRVALARALVNRPSVLLLDEPLGALDLRLREQMQIELKKLHKQLGITFVYVTHDQGEAMSMSDRIAVFAKGKIEQIDTPRMLYQKPATSFVADFVGGANVLRGELARSCGSSHPFAAIRGEQIRISPAASGPASDQVQVSGMLVDIQFHGAVNHYEVDVQGQLITAVVANRDEPESHGVQAGQTVSLSWPRHQMISLES
ncbi:putative spermidine/putrescine transport system ATP-binding protein [Oxalobacteraceae bacterium GrIS 2.11]